MLLFRKVYGQFNRGERAVLEYSVYNAGSNWLDKWGELVETRFGFTLKYFLDGIDVYYFDYVNQNGVEITLGWDNWTGCFLTTFSPTAESEKYVRGDWLAV